jgi:hypothetical protein
MMAHVKHVVVSRCGGAPSCTAVPVVALGGVVELFNLVEGWPSSPSAGSSTCCCELFASKIGIEAAGELYRA